MARPRRAPQAAGAAAPRPRAGTRVMTVKDAVRCGWSLSTPKYITYHDLEWRVPVHDDRTLFEFLVLEGAQAGLSWRTILEKRDNYRKAFDRFDPKKVARYDKRKIATLLGDA